ncbi:MAG TPA: IS110 family transposase [Acidimicrobiales bacterium]
MTTLPLRIAGGVDTHLDAHVAAGLDRHGALLGVESFETTPTCYRQLLIWLRGFGEVDVVGVEGTGSYGAGLTRQLHAEEVRVVEVDRPNRQRRRRRGKSDPQDAITAARAAQSGDAHGEAKTRDGNVESMRVLRVARISARKARTQALNQMRSLISTAPDDIRTELRHLNVYRLLERCSAFRAGARRDPLSLTKLTLRLLARRALSLETEIAALDAILEPLVADTAPELVGRLGIGTECASALLVAAGDNPERLRNEATFAHLCGASPIDASSGKQERHRLNRGGDRQANSALWKIVITRMVYDPRTRDYIERRVKDGLAKKEAIRCLKRYVAREVYNCLPRQLPGLDSP